MRSRLFALLACGLTSAYGILAAAGDDKDDDAKRIQGTWVVDPATYKDVKDKEILKEVLKAAESDRFIFEGNTFTLKHPPANEEKGGFRLDPTKKPKQIDQSDSAQGIYELEGDTLKLCWDQRGKDNGRPTKFAHDKDKATVHFYVLKREKPVAPPGGKKKEDAPIDAKKLLGRWEAKEAEARRRLALFANASVDSQNKNIQALRTALGDAASDVLDQIPFKARNRFSALRLRDGGVERVFVLGAPEALAAGAGTWDEELRRLRSLGLRVLSFAEVPSEHVSQVTFIPDTLPAPLRCVALIGLADELRPEAAVVLQALSAQGIAFKVISGDNPETVRGTVAHLDLPMSHEPVVTGDDLAKAENRTEFVESHSVFGRVEPQQKVEIVEALQKGGHHVAMIGDGVNDVLPIKRADLGIAMGEGSQAAKTVSSVVLENNDFALLPETIEEGRTIVRNLRRAAKLFLVKNVYSLLLILFYVAGVGGVPFPYLPQQVSLLNWMVIGIPALLIALTRERSRVVDRTPFLRDVGWFAVRTVVVFALAGVVLLALSKHLWDHDEKTQRTMLLTMLVLLGITVLQRVLTEEPINLSPRTAGSAGCRWPLSRRTWSRCTGRSRRISST